MKKVALYIFLAAFFFGTMEISLKLAGSKLDQMQLTFLRFMVGGLLLLPFAVSEIKRKEIRINLKDYLYMLLLGIVCIPMSMVLFQLGVMKANASTAAIIMCVNPLFTMFFAHFLIHEKMNRNNVIALLLSLAGILFMVNPLNMQEGNTAEGILMVLGGAALFGLYSVMGKVSVGKIGSMAQTSISFILGSLVLLVILLIGDKPVIAGVWPGNVWIVLYLSVFVTGLAYLFYFQAIAESNATTGSVTFLIKAAIAPALAVIILHEPMEMHAIIGIVLVLAGAILNILQKYKTLD
ncbi:MAG: DMT family transporter [Anaerovoracaceae bacterium]|jgi:drug/metabolite transporter (DMT)-like permease